MATHDTELSTEWTLQLLVISEAGIYREQILCMLTDFTDFSDFMETEIVIRH